MRQLIRGHSGRIQAGYDVAAKLLDYDVTADDARFYSGEWILTGHVQVRDTFLMEHTSTFVLELDVGTRRWRWKHVRVELAPDGKGVTVYGVGQPETLA